MYGIINRVVGGVIHGLGGNCACRVHDPHRGVKVANLAALHLGRNGSRFRFAFDVIAFALIKCIVN